MSSFLCFICHSTVNADTNEDMREKYREVVGMHLCPDSHLCHICCHVLNKLSLFRAVCLKRSLEYPVLFSEKGTLNLQRNDLEFFTLCPEESCGQYYNRNINSKTFNFHFSNYQNDSFSEYNQYQNDLLSNRYVELRDDFFNIEEQMFDSNFNLQLQQNNELQNLQSFNDNCVDDYSNTSTDYTQNDSENDFGRDLEDVRKVRDVENIRREEHTQMYSCREDELKQFVLYKNSYNCYQKPYANHNYETQLLNNQLNQDCVNINQSSNNLTLNNLNVYENMNIGCVKQNYLLNQQEKHENLNEMMHEFSTHQLTTLQCRNTNSCMELEGNNFKNDNINKTNIVHEIMNSNLITKEQDVTTNLQERHLYTDSDYCLTELVQTNKNIIQEENVPLFTNSAENQVKISTENEITKLHERLSTNLESEKNRIDEINITISLDNNITSFTNSKENLDKTLTNLDENKTDDQKTIEKSIHNQNDDDESIENQNDEDQSIENQNDEDESAENCSVSPIPSEIDEHTNTQSEIDENQLGTQEKSNKKQKTKEKGFIKIILTVEEQKAELEANRKDKKYLNAEFKCYNCALGFLFKDTYQAHMMRHEESNGEHKCSLCKLRFASLRVLRAHRASHAQRHQCLSCSGTVRGTRRSAHARICAEKEKVACHLCGKVFQDSSSLQQHLKRLHRATTTRNIKCVCNVCGETFNNHLAVRTHMLNHLTKKFTCPTCPATFSSPYTLNQHTKRHTNPYTDLHYCMTCGLSYTSRKSLLAHQRNALAHQESILECPLCAHTCPNQKSLTSHMESVHSNTKNYTCTLCPKRYTNKKSLVRHMGTHSGKKEVKKSVCHLCGSVFKGTNKLNRHLREVCEKTKLEEELASLYMNAG